MDREELANVFIRAVIEKEGMDTALVDDKSMSGLMQIAGIDLWPGIDAILTYINAQNTPTWAHALWPCVRSAGGR